MFQPRFLIAAVATFALVAHATAEISQTARAPITTHVKTTAPFHIRMKKKFTNWKLSRAEPMLLEFRTAVCDPADDMIFVKEQVSKNPKYRFKTLEVSRRFSFDGRRR